MDYERLQYSTQIYFTLFDGVIHSWESSSDCEEIQTTLERWASPEEALHCSLRREGDGIVLWREKRCFALDCLRKSGVFRSRTLSILLNLKWLCGDRIKGSSIMRMKQNNMLLYVNSCYWFEKSDVLIAINMIGWKSRRTEFKYTLTWFWCTQSCRLPFFCTLRCFWVSDGEKVSKPMKNRQF